MSQEEYEKLLDHSTTYRTSERCFEIQGGIDCFLINFVRSIINRNFTSSDQNRYRVNVFKSPDVLDKRNASPYYEKGEYVGYKWFSEFLNVSSNMCLYVEIHKDLIKKVL